MSFRELARSLAASALPVLDDIPVTCRLVHADGGPDYDTTTGNVYDTPPAESVVSVVLSPVGKSDRSNPNKENASIGDVEALILDVSQLVLRPAKGDMLYDDAKQEQYSVVDVTTDEAEATFTLTLKRLGGGVLDDVDS